MPINKDDPKYQASKEMVTEILKDLFGSADSDPLIEPVFTRYREKIAKERKNRRPVLDPMDPLGLAS